MVVGLLITGCVGILAVGVTFAAIIYYDAWSERRRQQIAMKAQRVCDAMRAIYQSNEAFVGPQLHLPGR